MADGDLQRGRAAVAEAEDVRLGDLERVQQRGDVVRVLLEGERPVDVERVAVGLDLDRDDAAAP
jgi:hypothetical protein